MEKKSVTKFIDSLSLMPMSDDEMILLSSKGGGGGDVHVNGAYKSCNTTNNCGGGNCVSGCGSSGSGTGSGSGSGSGSGN